MKLPLSLIRETLQKEFSVTLPPIAEDIALSCPAPLVPGTVPDRSRAYLCEAETVPPELDGCFVIRTGQPASEGGNGSCFSLPQPTAAVQDCLFRLWERAEAWKAAPEETVLAGGGLNELLQCAQELLHDPIVVYSADFTLRAQSGLEQLPDEWNFFDAQNGSMEVFTALQRDFTADPANRLDQPYIRPVRVLPCRVCHMLLTLPGREAENVAVLELSQSFGAETVWFLSVLAPYIRFLLERSIRAPGETEMQTVVQRALTDRTADYHEISLELTRLGWREGELSQCLLLAAGRDGVEVSARLGRYLERLFPCCCIALEGRLVVFLHTEDEKSLDEAHSRLKLFIRENFLKAGYSRAVRGHGNLRRQYKQSLSALELGRRAAPYSWIHRFDDHAFPYLLERIVHAMPCSMICHKGVLRLREYDRQNGSELLRTLRVFLGANGNAVRAASELFIHRSTLLYRLDKIRQIADCSLTDPTERDYLSLSLRLLELEEAQESDRKNG